MKKLAIVGAGAKAAAIVARAHTLHAMGVRKVPEIVVFEYDHIGAAWSGGANFSSGLSTLCTPGEKDVGFPYLEILARGSINSPISPELFSRYSWSAYLVANGLISEWVDRGRDYPTHSNWAKYLTWIFHQSGQKIVNERVEKITYNNNQWEIYTSENKKDGPQLVDGVVITGTGKSKSVSVDPAVPQGKVFDAETFWPHRNKILAGRDPTVAVAGDGGATGAIIAWLAKSLAEREAYIISISPMGTLFPRGDGYAERRWFSDPSEWRDLSYKHRERIIKHTEAGVISARNKNIIDLSPKIGFRRGKAVNVAWSGTDLVVEIDYDGEKQESHKADYFIGAIGFDSWSLLDLVDDESIKDLLIKNNRDKRRRVEEGILPDLSLPTDYGLPTGLHIPALAGLAYGPGMGNLGCLGLMAERVLRSYTK